MAAHCANRSRPIVSRHNLLPLVRGKVMNGPTCVHCNQSIFGQGSCHALHPERLRALARLPKRKSYSRRWVERLWRRLWKI